MKSQIVDVAVIGAGIAGLVCAQYLQQTGLRVIVVEKSRGVGGRVATRRLDQAWADHGLRYLEAQGTLSRLWIEQLLAQGKIQVWANQEGCIPVGCIPIGDTSIGYTSANGINAIAKALGAGLEIWRNQRVEAIVPTVERTYKQIWELTLVSSDESALRSPLQAKAIALAIPAPQALPLLQPLIQQGLPTALVSAVQSVEFAPCITAIAAYPPSNDSLKIAWSAVRSPQSSIIDWVSLETSKKFNPGQSTYGHSVGDQTIADRPVVVVQSKPIFADRYLQTTDLTPVGHQLLTNAAEATALPWLNFPEMLQVHRWRYAFATRPLSEKHLITSHPLPLVCCGDWCGGNQIENALESGLTAAQHFALELGTKLELLGERSPQPSLTSHFAQLLEKIDSQTNR